MRHSSGGNRITTLVGPNNSGKSTVVEALRALVVGSPHIPSEPQSFTEGRRNKDANERIVIRATEVDGFVGGLRTVESGGSETEWFPSRTITKIFVLPSRRYFNPLFSKGEATRDTYIASYGSPQTRGASLDYFGFRLFQVQRHGRQRFDDLLGEVIRPVPSWTIDQSDAGQFYLKIKRGGLYHSSEGMGEGLVSLFFIVDALYDSEPGDMVVIDEPELSLYPALQRRLFALLAKYSRDRQIVISTHSPYFVDFQSLTDGAKIVRVHLKNGSSSISTVSEATVVSLGKFLNNFYNPHILGLDAREAFFLEDGIILVEGQEDVVLYRQIATQLSVHIAGDFFGWGVGGADNMLTIATLLNELGFSKVAGLLDGNRTSLLPKLQAAFPKYQFYAIPADDVRTKPTTRSREAVLGILDESGHVRAEYVEPMRKLFALLNKAV